MKHSTSKAKLTTAIAIVILLISAFVVMINTPVQAQLAEDQPASGPLPDGVTPSVTVDVNAYLSFRPNPVGVDQTVLVNFWCTPGLNPERFHPDYKVTITDPDGNKEERIIDSYCADATAWFEFTPNQVGDWKLKFDFAGTYFPAGTYLNGYVTTNGTGNDLDSAYYPPSSTPEQTLTVQEDMIYSWPPAELPTDYWTRPISPENREWWPIAGNYPPWGIVGYPGYEWPEDTNSYASADYDFIPYVQAPNTAHIVWRRQGAISGLIGGTHGIYSDTGGGGTPSVIYAGRCYDTMTVPVNGVPTSCAVCYDLRTGEMYYAIPTAEGGVTPNAISYGKSTAEAVPGATEGQSRSVTLMSIGSTLYKIDAWTGAVTFEGEGMSGTLYKDPYALSIQSTGSIANRVYYLINWTTEGTTPNFANRIISNVSLPWAMPIWPGGCLGFTRVIYDFEANIAGWMVGVAEAGTGAYYGTWIMTADLTTGALLMNETFYDTRYSTSCWIADHGKVACLMQNGYFMAWNSRTGAHEWTSEKMGYPWGEPSFGAYDITSAHGLLYRQSYDGVYAFDWDDGTIEWVYHAPAVAYETPYTDSEGNGVYSFNSAAFVADGKLYTYNSEHSTTQPITRGWGLHCMNATTGEGIWNITGAMAWGPVADGYLTASNSYDGYTYCFGKGKSATTVTAPDVEVPEGTAVLIKGSVLDLSPAQPGTPCVSAESMATYMEYLHMQKPIPDGYTVTGVPVMLLAFDADDNVINIDTTMTDMSGKFAYAWTPPDEGLYKITATFLGDDSYGSSWDETAVFVGPAPSPAVEPETEEPTTEEPTTEEPTTEEPTTEEPTTEEPTTQPPETAEPPPIITTEVAIVIAVAIAAIIGVGAFWVLRRRK